MTAVPERITAAGLLLAAGAGRRMGTPKALLRDDAGDAWLHRSVRALREGGCARVVVVLGAAYDEARSLVPSGVEVVHAEGWEQGMGESLRAGLVHLQTGEDTAAVVSLVDLPDVDAPVVARVLARWVEHERPDAALVRAVYDGAPGHPVVLGRRHWAALLDTVSGDVGAQTYLSRVDVGRRVDLVECADLATGRDVDRPPRSGA